MHSHSGDILGKAITRYDGCLQICDSNPRGIPLEEFPKLFPSVPNFNLIQDHRIAGENSWIHRFSTFLDGYNTRREKAKPRPPHIPSDGFVTRPVKRSRDGVRVTKMNGGYQVQKLFVPGLERWDKLL